MNIGYGKGILLLYLWVIIDVKFQIFEAIRLFFLYYFGMSKGIFLFLAPQAKFLKFTPYIFGKFLKFFFENNILNEFKLI